MTEFNSITLILAAIIFAIAGENQDPITLRLLVSYTSAAMMAALYCGFTQDSRSAPTLAVLTACLIAATLAEPDPSIIQMLLAFVCAPIITCIAINRELKDDIEALVESSEGSQNRTRSKTEK